MEEAPVRYRKRVPDDIPGLAQALWAQQPESSYPFRSPLPIPVEDFLHASDSLGAWVADVEGRPVGHVCLVGVEPGTPDPWGLLAVCAREHGCRPDELAWVSAFFTAAGVRRIGIGRRLLQQVTQHARSTGLRPCLEVLPIHPAALDLYLVSGWKVVDRVRPDWLTDAAPDVHVMVLPPPPS